MVNDEAGVLTWAACLQIPSLTQIATFVYCTVNHRGPPVTAANIHYCK